MRSHPCLPGLVFGSIKKTHKYLLKNHNKVDLKLKHKLNKSLAKIKKVLKNDKLTPKLLLFIQLTMLTSLLELLKESRKKKTIKREFLSKEKFLYFTQDVLRAPNFSAPMGDTTHFIEQEFQMFDMTILLCVLIQL
ncbi:hypothetical protein VP01_1768g1 [Puccinia sorghi]|uniref:Uncharacterized protein n=1 Tax=Puccinia sorghi TaxID=27349 RepID=A0A0L6VEV6_9BASI|nr:hypothetical protein VP01_1768g1 [Puccinia sorghi]